MKIRACLLAAALLLTASAHAESADEVRGGWQADVGGVRHLYMLTIRGTAITGTYCTDCSNVDDLAFIQNGVLAADGLRFEVHNPGPKAYTETVQAHLVDGELRITRQRRGSSAAPVTMALQRTKMPQPAAVTPRPPAPPSNYVPPGPAETLSPAKVAGLWLTGAGPNKQYFMFKQVGNGLRGLVCGPCNDTDIMAPLEQIRIDGTTLEFSIVHESNGRRFYQGPFSNVVRATIARNEMHLSVVPSYEPAGFTPIEMNLLGPVKQ